MLRPSMVEVRSATPADEEAIVSLWVGLLLYHRSIEKNRPRRWQRPADTWQANLLDRLRAAWRDPERHAVFVALIQDEIVGFIRTHLDAEGPLPAHIDTLFVAERHRGAGVGRALMRTAERWCLEHGADEIGVEFIAPNDDARLSYERLGYKPFLVTYMRRLREPTDAS
jgi:GNAT superfamily N-acetyltransferase